MNGSKEIMKKSVKFIAALTATVLTLGVAGCQKSTVYPDFINPDTSIEKPETKEKYVVNVQSVGGLPLDGVVVNAVANGSVVKRGISVNGQIDFAIALGEYELRVDESSLPAGYKMPETTYKTSATSRDSVTIKLPCELIPAAQSAQCSYALYTMMVDFTFKDCNGQSHTLSSLLKTRKAVVLNFWYTGCNPCRSEFPAIQKAYASRDDVEILAICSTHQGDTNSDVSKFKDEYGLQFPMGVDTLGLNNSFSVAAFPTTVIIDRYGMIAEKMSGSETSVNTWTTLFNKYTADNYVQERKNANEPGTDPGTKPNPQEKPDIKMPASSVLEAAANGEGFSATYRPDDSEYSWPWLAGQDPDGSTYIYSSNKGKHSSYSIVYVDIDMKKDDVLSFEYNVDSEADADYLHVFLDGDLMNGDGYSATDGWLSTDIYVADRDRTVELAFAFQKDSGDPDTFKGDDVAKIRNIHLSDVNSITSPIDVMRSCANGATEDSTKYDFYAETELGDDGFYHIKDTGALVYISLSNITPWTDMHTSSMTVTGGTTYYSTLYNLTYYNYAVNTESVFNVTIGGVDFTETVKTYWSIQSYMPGPYYLIPLTADLQQWAQKFAEEYEKKLGATAHDKEWLEFCFYYDHYGSENHKHPDGEECYVDVDHTRGLTINNSFEAFEKNDPNIVNAEKYNSETGRMVAEINYPLQLARNGTYYKFKATKGGVYQLRSYTTDCSSNGVSPDLSVYDQNGRMLYTAGDPRDFDQFKGEKYEGFNYYVTLKENQTVYLMLEDAPSATGYYEFDIEYKGETYETMYVCTTASGMWSGNNGETYLAIKTVYDYDTDCFYAANRNGTPNMDKPIYIDMIHGSFLYSELANSTYQPLEYLIENHIYDRFIIMGDLYQKQLEDYLARSKEVGEDDEMYGLVKADATLVNIINAFFDRFVDGGKGDGNGWLAFAVYTETFGS